MMDTLRKVSFASGTVARLFLRQSAQVEQQRLQSRPEIWNRNFMADEELAAEQQECPAQNS